MPCQVSLAGKSRVGAIAIPWIWALVMAFAGHVQPAESGIRRGLQKNFDFAGIRESAERQCPGAAGDEPAETGLPPMGRDDSPDGVPAECLWQQALVHDELEGYANKAMPTGRSYDLELRPRGTRAGVPVVEPRSPSNHPAIGVGQSTSRLRPTADLVVGPGRFDVWPHNPPDDEANVAPRARRAEHRVAPSSPAKNAVARRVLRFGESIDPT